MDNLRGGTGVASTYGQLKGVIVSTMIISLLISVAISGAHPYEQFPIHQNDIITSSDSTVVNLTCEQNTSILKVGESFTYLINVTNTGPGTDTINLTINNPTDWRAHFNDNPPDRSRSAPVPKPLATSYRNYSGTIAEIYSIQSAHPEIVNVTVIGTTWEGRDIVCVKVSDNVTVDEPEPETLIMGMHHAREWMSVEVVMYFLNHLVDNYGTEAQSTWNVDNREIFLIPIVNPDGYWYSQNIGDWRKNMRDNGDGTFGVDLNRNYNGSQNGDPNGDWGGAGASHTTGNEVYCGPSAFSEPESQAIRDLILARDFTLTISYHSYGREIYWPWGYDTGVQAPHHAEMQAISEGMAAINGYTPMQSAFLYETTGDSDDWIYGYNWYQLGRFISAHTIELDYSFQPPASQIDGTCALNLGVNYYGSETAGNIYLNSPVIDHDPFPDTEDPGPYTISANITTPVGLKTGATKLFWNVSGTWNEVEMNNTTGNTWEADIPGQANGTWVQYYIVTEDLNNHSGSEPKYSPYEYHMFRVGPDLVEILVEVGSDESKIIKFVVEAPISALPNEVAIIDVIGTSQMEPTEWDSVETVTMVQPSILLVEADNPSQQSYRDALDNNGYVYDEGRAGNTDLLAYEVVIWPVTGARPLSMTDRMKIQSYLNGGGNLYINGEDIGWQANDEGWLVWYNTYLHADYIADDSFATRMNGIPGDPITDGMTDFTITGNYPEEIQPADANTTTIFEYNSDNFPCAAVKSNVGKYRIVYIGCEYFEGSDPQANKDLLMYRIIEWLLYPPVTFDIPLGPSRGWYFVSVPVNVTGPAEDVLSDDTGDGLTVWTMVRWYDPEDATDPWRSYSPLMPPELCDMPDINNGIGIWIFITEVGDGYLTVMGQEPGTTVIHLKTGWNMVGYPSLTPRIAAATLPPSVDKMAVYSSTEPYQILDVTDMGSVNMTAGNAYWVHSSSDATWTVDW